MAKKVIENSYEVLAIEFLAIIQAIDYLGIQERLSGTTMEIYQQLRALVPVFIDDSPKYREINELKIFLEENNPEVLL